MAVKDSKSYVPYNNWCLENAEHATLSFIYSVCLPLSGFTELPTDKEKWREDVSDLEKELKYNEGDLKFDVGVPCDKAQLEKTKFTRKGFDPILNNRLASSTQHWLCGNLDIDSCEGAYSDIKDEDGEPASINVSPESAGFLVRFNAIGVCTITLTITLKEPQAEHLFTALDLVRRNSPNKIKVNLPWDKEKNSYTLNNIFQEISGRIVQWRVDGENPVTSQKEEDKEAYQCPYVVSYIRLPNMKIENLPWGSENFFDDNQDKKDNGHDEEKIEEQFRKLKQIMAILIRPKMWPEYLTNDFKAFRVPYHLLKRHWFASHDFFWDKRGILLFDPRSTVFLDALPEKSLSDLTFSSLMDILETIRARWHFFIELNNTLDSLTNDLEDPNTLLKRMTYLRKWFTKSLTYTLPYSQTATHLVELAAKAEQELMVKDLEDVAIRKFEAANWLYTDSTETERRVWMGKIEKKADFYKDPKNLMKEINDTNRYLEELRNKYTEITGESPKLE